MPSKRFAAGEPYRSEPAHETIQFNHEWTRINTNEDNCWRVPWAVAPIDSLQDSSPPHFIGVHSCPFVVPTSWRGHAVRCAGGPKASRIGETWPTGDPPRIPSCDPKSSVKSCPFVVETE